MTVAAVVRLGLYARRQEIEIMELVGAPFSYIRGPFVAEGLIQGGLGALLAVAALAIGFVAVRAWWGSRIGEALAGFDLQFLPVQMLLWLVLGGMAVGAAGGLAAARHAG